MDGIGGARERLRRHRAGEPHPAGQRDRLPAAGGIGVDPLPRGGAAVVRVIAVLAPHSSTKTSRCGSIPASSSQNSRRCSRTSGLSWSQARDLLLARQPQPAQGAGDGGETARGAEVLAALLERGIGPVSDQLAEPLEVLGL